MIIGFKSDRIIVEDHSNSAVDGQGPRFLEIPLTARQLLRAKCFLTIEAQRDRVEHFIRRIGERGATGKDFVVLVINVDDETGGQWATDLMPGENWQPIRDRGEIPVARGLGGRDSVQAALAQECPEAAGELLGIPGIAIIVIDHGTITAFDALKI